jgi:dihydrofolate synthase/folylpolyglutamate synthase
LFTSPHLVSFRERIQVNRQLIPEADVVRLVTELQPLLKQFATDHHPTFFEVVTVMALKYFAEQKCDLVIWETGLGGRLDATNIVMPLASVITNIGYDHQQWLGDTLEKIAMEKAGIIKPGVPVLTATDEPVALAVIGKVAREKNSTLTRVEINSASRIPHPASLSGEHQQRNAALAVATVEVLQNKIPVPAEAIRRGLETVRWPGRLQLVERPGGRNILLDGAHNVASAKALVAALRSGATVSNTPLPNMIRAGSETGVPTLVLGVLADKDWRAMCEVLAPLARKILLVPVGSERTASPQELAPVCRATNPQAAVEICDSLASAMAQAKCDSFVVITGSLYLVGEAMELLHLAEVPASDEKSLNEWKVKQN